MKTHIQGKIDNHERFHRFDDFVCTFQDIKQEFIEKRIWNIPNLVMLSRLALGIYLIQTARNVDLHHRWVVIPIAALLVLLDMLDGFLARKLHQETKFGKVFDPFKIRNMDLMINHINEK